MWKGPWALEIQQDRTKPRKLLSCRYTLHFFKKGKITQTMEPRTMRNIPGQR